MGICRVHRAQVLAVQGHWAQAEAEVLRVCDELAHFHVSIVGEAFYELGELRRRRRDFVGAEDSYREALKRGRDPQPGLALLHVARGNPRAAALALDAFLGIETDPLARARHVAARVQVALALDDLEAAESACQEVEATAELYGSSGLRAVALHLRGASLLKRGAPSQALPVLRGALRSWNALPAPYESAQVRDLIAAALDALGDHEAAVLERDAAAAALKELRGEARSDAQSLPAGLTPRELEVPLLAAEGRSNGEIAEALVLSTRTVERHLATTYSKLGLEGRNARSAAVGFALRQGLSKRKPT